MERFLPLYARMHFLFLEPSSGVGCCGWGRVAVGFEKSHVICLKLDSFRGQSAHQGAPFSRPRGIPALALD